MLYKRILGAVYDRFMHSLEKKYLVSPLFGELSGLPEISIFTGTHDILNVDARELRTKLQSENFPYRYYEYPGIVHDWFIIPPLCETRHIIRQL